jgi:hypothetical protein
LLQRSVEHSDRNPLQCSTRGQDHVHCLNGVQPIAISIKPDEAGRTLEGYVLYRRQNSRRIAERLLRTQHLPGCSSIQHYAIVHVCREQIDCMSSRPAQQASRHTLHGLIARAGGRHSSNTIEKRLANPIDGRDEQPSLQSTQAFLGLPSGLKLIRGGIAKFLSVAHFEQLRRF